MSLKIKTNIANKNNYGSMRALSSIKYIVIHYTANDGDTDENNGTYFHNNYVGASAHYFVDSDSATQSVPDNYEAWHCGYDPGGQYYHSECRNYNSIGIEICDDNRNGSIYPSAKTIANAIELTKLLMAKYHIPAKNVIRHYDCTHKLCPAYWCGSATKDKKWETEFKSKLTAVKIKKDTSAYKYGYKDPISNTSIPVITLAKGTAVDWLYDDGTGWSKIKYKGKEYFVPNTRFDKNGLSKYSTITLPAGKKVYRIKNGKLCKATTLKKKRKFTVICSISAGKYKGYKVLNRNGKEYYYK